VRSSRRAGEFINARVRYFDPTARRAGLPADVGRSCRSSRHADVVTLVNLSPTEAHTVVQARYGEHQIESIDLAAR